MGKKKQRTGAMAVVRRSIVFLCHLALLGFAECAALDSIRFIDNSHGAYLKHNSVVPAINVHDVTAATAVLLGLHPPSTINPGMDRTLTTLLADDAFSRPQAVCAITLLGAGALNEIKAPELAANPPHQTRHLANSSALQLSHAFHHLTGASPDLVQDMALDFRRGSALDGAAMDEALEALAAASKASYQRGSGPASGKVTVHLPEGEPVQFDLSQDADYLLATELAQFERSAQALSASPDQRQFLTATLHGIQVIKSAYGPQSRAASAATSLVFKTVARVLDSLDKTFQGKLVTLLSTFESEASLGPKLRSEAIAGVASTRREMLQAGAVPGAAVIAAYALTNKSVAWGVGILFVIFTIVTVLALVCMPITKDTLLYSRAKID